MPIKQRDVPGIGWVRRPANRRARARDGRPSPLYRASPEASVRGKAYFAPAVELQAEAWIGAVLNRTGKEKTWALVSEATTLGLLADAPANYDEQFPKASKADRARAKHLWERCCPQIDGIEVSESEEKQAWLRRLHDALKA